MARGNARVNAGVWAVGDGVRVNPETGKLLEARPDIHADAPRDDWRGGSLVWDAAAGRVRLHAARNEFVAFQAIVGADTPLRDITVRLGALRGPGGATIAAPHVALFKAWYVKVDKPSSGYPKTSLGPGWYADALMPAEADGVVKLEIPDRRNGIGPSQRNHAVWVDLYVPRNRKDAPPGRYTGTLSVVWPGGRKDLAVDLEVWDFALPDEIHCRGDIYNGSLRRMPPQQELLWYQMARRHRFQPGVAHYRPDLTIRGETVRIDWKAYDRRLGRYLDGSAFTEAQGYWGPGRGEALGHILLPFDCSHGGKNWGWPLAMPMDQPPADGAKRDAKMAAFEKVWLETCRLFKQHFDADPRMRKVRKVIFLGHLDESYNEAAYAKMIYYCKLLRRGFGEKWFTFRIDGGYSASAMEKLCPYVDLWVCHTAGYDTAKMDRFRARGVEPWFYGPMVYESRANSASGSNTLTDLELLSCRGVGWAAWKLRSGYCQWEFDALYDEKKQLKRPTRPYEPAWRRAMNCRYGRNEYNGSGLLIYRGELTGQAGPIASIRLKAHRRGFQDYEYFHLLREARLGRDADAMVNTILVAKPFGRSAVGNINIWKHDPDAWEAVRLRAGKLLHKAATRNTP